MSERENCFFALYSWKCRELWSINDAKKGSSRNVTFCLHDLLQHTYTILYGNLEHLGVLNNKNCSSGTYDHALIPMA